jgi:SAM-dependent methyltransferase
MVVNEYTGLSELEAAERNLKRYLSRKANLIMRLMEGSRIFEVGCGIGTYTRFFSERGCRIVACDVSADCLREAKDRGIVASFLQADILKIDTHNELLGKFDSVLMITVLEHVENDFEALLEARMLLRNDGCLILVVPAHGFLFSEVDRRIGHHRRYSKSGLCPKVTSAGFRIEYCRYWDFLGLIGWLVKSKLAGSGRISPDLERPVFDKFYDRWLGIEDHVPVPLGVNIVIKARRIG